MIQSLMRAIDLLEILKTPNKAFSISELSDRLNLPPSTVHRILQTFCARGYVSKDDNTHLYRLGPALISLGTAASQNLRLQDMSRPVLENLSRDSGEDAFLVIRAANKGLVLDKVEGANILKVVEKFGAAVDLHCGAIRKALLAYQDEDFIHTYVASKLSAPGAPSAEELLSQLAEIRKNGVGCSCGDYITGAVGIGAPVFKLGGKIVASIGIIAPEDRISGSHRTDMIELVKSRAQELSYYMGYSPVEELD